MILNSTPEHQATMSNVSQISTFAIKATAKSFHILSSGLYANKIRAIIRELSCNAYDSHVAAGKKDTPFDVHLPNTLEPHFSIRDYGTGLSHDQVTNIYTTYFESTKTDSNDFVGALGLGSKSPFSYTDNFTVTAVQNGRKGIYTAFINDQGVPSIALMMEEPTDDPSGVEVKFAVNGYGDYDKFRQEAHHVYTHFSLRPVISGANNFQFRNVAYESKDIIPGVHQISGERSSRAVMGNIAYPIDIPKADNGLGDLRGLLNCGLEMHFAIGELDFQASREGLSYIPSTIESIRAKLAALNSSLADKLAVEAGAINNLWERAAFLAGRKNNTLWKSAVDLYSTRKPIPTFDHRAYGGVSTFTLRVTELAQKYNINLRSFSRIGGVKTVSSNHTNTEYGEKDASGHHPAYQVWKIAVDTSTHFVLNDLKTGAAERAKYHYRNSKHDVHRRTVYVINPADRTKPMNLVGFFAEIHNPPKVNHFQASSLLQKPRAQGLGRNVTIMKLERRGGSYRNRQSGDMVWRDAGKADSFDANNTYYYVPLIGFQMQSSKGYGDAKHFHGDVTALPGLFTGEIYGVRKGDIADIKLRKNWVNLEDHITKVLNGVFDPKLLMSVVKSRLEETTILDLSNQTILPLIGNNSPYATLVNEFKNVDNFKGSVYNLSSLFAKFAPNANLSPDALVNKYNQMFREVNRRYPLLVKLNTYRTEASDIAEYINMCDQKKGI